MNARAVVQLGREPFGRWTRTRERVPSGSCSWCGTNGRLWYYGRDHDAGRSEFLAKGFCSIGCFRSYTGEPKP